MECITKLLITIAIIVFCSQIGRKTPTLSGLITTMPINSLLVLIWLYTDNPGNLTLMEDYTKGVLWGTIPTILFFMVAYFCFHKHLPFSVVLSTSYGVWLMGALIHQWFFHR